MTILAISDNPRELLARACMAAYYTQAELAKISGCSLRTVSRWTSGETYPSLDCFRALAARVLPTDPELAAELAAAGRATIAMPSAVAPPPPPPPPMPPPIPPRLLAEAVVCAAAEELDASPRIVRGALRAAFVRLREVGLTVEGMIEVLAPPVGPPATGGAKTAKEKEGGKGKG